MTTSDWITLGAAILVGGGTLFLGIMAWRTIRQTRTIQKAEKRERLLNEIIEWATDIVNYILESDVFDIVTFRQGLYPDNTFEELFYEVKNLRIARAKSTKILTIAHQVDQALNEKIEEKIQTLVNELKVQISHLTEYRRDPQSGSTGDMGENIKKLKNAATYNENIISLATAVIEEATKIKTRDIS